MRELREQREVKDKAKLMAREYCLTIIERTAERKGFRNPNSHVSIGAFSIFVENICNYLFGKPLEGSLIR